MRCEHIMVLFLLSQSKYLYKALVLPFIKFLLKYLESVIVIYLVKISSHKHVPSAVLSYVFIIIIVKFYNFFQYNEI